MVYSHVVTTQMDLGSDITKWAKGQFPTIPTDKASAKTAACDMAEDAITKEIGVLSGGATSVVSFGATLFGKDDPIKKALDPAMSAIGC